MKPTVEEQRLAIEEAERLRAAGEDRHCLAKTLLYQHDRLQHLEEVRQLAERLVHFGQDEHEHARLLKALESARRAEERATGGGDEFGLA